MRFFILPLALSLAVAPIVGCGISEEIYNRDMSNWEAKTTALEQTQQTLEAERADLEAKHAADAAANAATHAALEGEKALCLTELAKVSNQKGAVSASLSQALEQLNRMQQIAAKQKAMLSGLLSSLDEMVSAGKVNVVKRNGRLVVQVSENILFASGRSTLKTEGKEALAQIAPVLANVKREFQVAGHTDNVGDAGFNWKLSIDRSFSVLNTLIEAGYPQERLSAAGYAWFQPVATNDTDEGRQLNRRVDLVLVPNLNELKLPTITAAPACHRYTELAAR
ncbi:MAG: chemotaxis protein MotB [Myxococcota bacterium]|jgi:chemotaxis protein MotB